MCHCKRKGGAYEATAPGVNNFVRNSRDHRARLGPKLPMVRTICRLRQSELRVHDLCPMHGVALWKWRGLQSESAIRALDAGAAPARGACQITLGTCKRGRIRADFVHVTHATVTPSIYLRPRGRDSFAAAGYIPADVGFAHVASGFVRHSKCSARSVAMGLSVVSGALSDVGFPPNSDRKGDTGEATAGTSERAMECTASAGGKLP